MVTLMYTARTSSLLIMRLLLLRTCNAEFLMYCVYIACVEALDDAEADLKKSETSSSDAEEPTDIGPMVTNLEWSEEEEAPT